MIKAQQIQIAELLEEVSQIPCLLARIQSLEAQVNQNSQNSHKPPSSDQGKPKRKTGLPASKAKKPKGGQKGHKGKTLEMVSTPDVEVAHHPSVCDCGCSVLETDKVIVEKRQVFNLPPAGLIVTEHTISSCTCPNCGKEVLGEFPAAVSGRVQYGDDVKALCVLLNVAYNLPYAKVKRIFEDLYGYALNESTQLKAQTKCFDLLAASEPVIQQHLLSSPVNHFDETGMNVNGKNHWLHGCSNKDYTYLFAHPNRGKKAIGSEQSLFHIYKGWAVHDCWSSYFSYHTGKHAICGAHILRELNALKEQGSIWADRMWDLLIYAYEWSQKGLYKVSQKELKKISRQYDWICQKANQEEPPPEYNHKGKKPKQTKGRNLMDRLVKHKAAVLAFAQFEEVPFTNNQAERDVRPSKTKQKVAGGFRTFKGLERFARIQSFISTVRKQGHNVLQQLTNTFCGYNFLTKQIA